MPGLNPIVPYDPPESDPYWDNVLWLLKGEGLPSGQNLTFTDSSSHGCVFAPAQGSTNISLLFDRDSSRFSQGNFSPFSDPTTGSVQMQGTNYGLAIKSGDYNKFIFNADYTLECWFYPFSSISTYATSSTTLNFPFFGHSAVGPNNNDVYGTHLFIASDGSIHWSFYDNVPFTFTNLASSRRTDKLLPGFLTAADKFKWVHIAVSRQNNIVRIFKNGQLFTSWEDNGSSYLINYASTAVSESSGLYSIKPDGPAGWDNSNGLNPSIYFSGDAGKGWIQVSTVNNLSSDFTIEGHVNISSSQLSAGCIFSIGSTVTNRFSLHTDGSSIFLYSTSSGTPTADIYTRRISVGAPINTWFHYAVVKLGTAVSLFINGILSATWNASAATAITTVQSPIYRVGYSSVSTTDFFNGYIASFRVVSGTALYSGNFVPPSTQLQNISGTTVLLKPTATVLGDSKSFPGVGYIPANGLTGNGFMTNLRVINGTCIYNNNFSVPTSRLEDIENTVLLCRFEDYDLVDSTKKFNITLSPYYTTANSALFTSTATSKFGNASLYFDCRAGTTPISVFENFIHTGGYSIAGGADPFALGSGAFTIDFWVYPTITVSRRSMLYCYALGTSAGTGEFSIYIDMSTLKPALYIYGFMEYAGITRSTAATYTLTATCPQSIALNDWTHVALTRAADGLTYNWVINGTSAGVSYPAGFLTGATGSIVRKIDRSSFPTIACNADVGGAHGTNLTSMSGLIATYIDEFRVTRGVVRDFSPYSSPAQEINTILPSYPTTNLVMLASIDYNSEKPSTNQANSIITATNISETSQLNINKSSMFEETEWS